MEYLCHKWPQICSTCRKHFPVLSSFMTYHRFVTRLTRRVSLVEQELLTLPEHLSSPPVFSGGRVTRSYVLLIVVCPFILFLLAIVLSVLLRYTDFGIFKLFLCILGERYLGFWELLVLNYFLWNKDLKIWCSSCLCNKRFLF
jgi:hypothetical protein